MLSIHQTIIYTSYTSNLNRINNLFSSEQISTNHLTHNREDMVSSPQSSDYSIQNIEVHVTNSY